MTKEMINCAGCNKELHSSAMVCPNCGCVIKIVKNKFLAMLLCWFFGVLGMHKFYLGELKKGYFYLTLIVMGFVLLIAGELIILSNNQYQAIAIIGAIIMLLGILFLFALCILVLIDLIKIITMNEKKWVEKYYQ